MDGDPESHTLPDEGDKEDVKNDLSEPMNKSPNANESVKTKDAKFISPTFTAPKRNINKPKRELREKSERGPESNNKNNVMQSHDVTAEKGLGITNDVKKGESAPVKLLQIPFKPPSWCCMCNKNYSFEILKGGVIKGEISLTEKPYYIFGRLEGCDVMMEHPSISRYHAVVVYKGADDNQEVQSPRIEEGFYVMDLGSTHGTIVNKIELKPKVFHRLRVGYVVRFGGSSRLHILQGPQEDQDDEMEMKIIKQPKDLSNVDEEAREEEENNEDDGITWGMAEDAVEEEVDLEKLLASRKPLDLKDPKKTLRGFFEREGLDLEYEADERGTGNSKVFVIKVRLPIEDASGEEIFAEGTSTKKKDAVVACAYEACRIIDAHGMLRNAIHESERSKKAKRLAENDFYDSDDDSFLDRTGAVESKREKRMKKAGKAAEERVETYDSLMESLENCEKEIGTIERSLEEDARAEKLTSAEGADDLDEYMMLVAKRLDKKTRISFKHRLALLRKEQRRIERLMKIAKPAQLPALVVPQSDSRTLQETESSLRVHHGTKNEEDEKPVGSQGIQSQKPHKTAEKLEVKDPSRNVEPAAAAVSRVDPKVKETEERPPEKKKAKKSAKKRIYGPQVVPSSDSKFADWLPPQDQTGDGKTHLNAKFGY